MKLNQQLVRVDDEMLTKLKLYKAYCESGMHYFKKVEFAFEIVDLLLDQVEEMEAGDEPSQR